MRQAKTPCPGDRTGYSAQLVTPLERIAARTTKTETCWTCDLGLNGPGYSQVSVSGRLRLSHRVVYEHHFGPIPPSMTIDHICRTRNCVRPDHLRVLTNRDNLMAEGSTAPARLNAQKTHCPRGHPYDEENTYRDKRGFRYCRICERDKTRRLRARKRSPKVAIRPRHHQTCRCASCVAK